MNGGETKLRSMLGEVKREDISPPWLTTNTVCSRSISKVLKFTLVYTFTNCILYHVTFTNYLRLVTSTMDDIDGVARQHSYFPSDTTPSRKIWHFTIGVWRERKSLPYQPSIPVCNYHRGLFPGLLWMDTGVFHRHNSAHSGTHRPFVTFYESRFPINISTPVWDRTILNPVGTPVPLLTKKSFSEISFLVQFTLDGWYTKTKTKINPRRSLLPLYIIFHQPPETENRLWR